MSRRGQNTQQRLLEIAKREFLRNGFSEVSMRDISKATGMALGNIYYYYKTKDELYMAILSPLLLRMKEYMKYHNESNSLMEDILCMEKDKFDEYLKSPRCTSYFDLLLSHRDEFYMLFYLSSGSSLEKYEEELQLYLVEMGYEYLEKYMKVKKIKIEVDEKFMKIYSTMMIALMKEIVKKKKIPLSELRRLYIQFCLFSMNGWKTLMRI